MTHRNFVTLRDWTADEISALLDRAAQIKAKPDEFRDACAGKALGLLFQKSSTRTRVSFEVGIAQLGGTGLFLGARDLQLGRGEPIRDTARVLGRYLDGLMARTYAHQDVLDLATHSGIPVINGLTDLLHPCQVMADLQSIREVFGGTRGLRLAYVGDGNNVAHSLMFGASRAGMDFVCATPRGYEMKPEMVALGQADAAAAGTAVIETDDVGAAVADAHVVYTDVWASMGQEEEAKQRVRDFAAYQVDATLMKQAASNAIFMHCLPAHRGEEVSAEVCDGPQSIIIDQAENRLHAQKAILVELMGRG